MDEHHSPDVKVQISGSNRSSEDDLRLDQPWTNETEALVTTWMNQCFEAGNAHDKAGYKHKRLHKMFSIPNITLPLLFTSLTSVVDETTEAYPYINSVGFFLSGVVAGMLNFFDHSSKTEKHFNFAHRYNTIALTVESQLAKPRQFRLPVDVFQSQIRLNIAELNANAPEL